MFYTDVGDLKGDILYGQSIQKNFLKVDLLNNREKLIEAVVGYQMNLFAQLKVLT